MKFFSRLLVLSFFLAGCQYRFGTESSLIQGQVFVGVFENNSQYRTIGAQLQNNMISVLRRQKGVILTSADRAELTFKGNVLKVNKLYKEGDANGKVVEVQFEIKASLSVYPKDDSPFTIEASNLDFQSTSGIFRENENTEEQALAGAISDLAEALIQKVSLQF